MPRDAKIATPPILTFGLPVEEAALAQVGAGASGIAGIVRIVAFGSRVRGDFRIDSDMDLLVILDDIEELFDVPFSPVLYTVREYEENRRLGSRFVENVEREGKVLYDALAR